MAPAEAAQEGPEGGWRLDHAAENTDRPTGTQRIGVVNAVAARQRGSDQRQQLVPRVGPPRRAAEVEVIVYEFPQAQAPGEGGRKKQPGIGHQAVVIKDNADPVGIVLWQHLLGAPCFQAVFCSKTIIPDSEEHSPDSSRSVPRAVLRWIRAKVVENTDAVTLQGFVVDQTDVQATVYSDEHAAYRGMGRRHEAVKHSAKEYVNGMAHTTGIESHWAMLKRGQDGVYHPFSTKHLNRYVGEFSGRHNQRPMDTVDQMDVMANGAVGRRLRYQDLIGE